MRLYVARSGYAVAFMVLLNVNALAQTKVSGANEPATNAAAISPVELKERLYKDSLERVLLTAPDSTKFKLLFALDQAYITSNPAKSLAYEKRRLAVAEKLQNLHFEASAYIALSRTAIYLNDIPNAKTWLEKGYSLAEQVKDSSVMTKALLNLGAVSQASSDQAACLDYYLRSLRIAKAIKDTTLINFNSINIGGVHYAEGNYDKAEAYILPVLSQIDSVRGDPQQAPKAMEMLGNIYVKENKFALARRYYDNGIRLYARQRNDLGLATIYAHMVGLYTNKPDSALYFAFLAKDIWDRTNPDYFMTAENIFNIGSMYFAKATDSLHLPATNKAVLLRKAEQYSLIALAASKKTHRAEELIGEYEQLAQIYGQLHDYKQAFESANDRARLNDSLFSQEEKNKLASMDEKYQVQLREDQLSANRHSFAVQARRKYYLLAGIALLAVIGGLLYWQSRTRKSLNTRLQLLNRQLDEANEVKTRFVGILNHDLKAPVANLINILHLQREGSGILDAPTAAVHSERIKSQAENLLETMEDMLSWSKGQMKNFQPQRRAVGVADLFTDVERHFSGTPGVNISFAAPEGMVLHTDEYFLKTIMRNLTSNAVKSLAGRPDASIWWRAAVEGGKAVLSITDNGPGVTEAQLQPLYDQSMPSSLKAGLGLHLVRDLSKAIGCIITVSPTPGQGTQFLLTL